MKSLYVKMKTPDGTVVLQPLESFAKDINVEIVEFESEKAETGKKRGRPKKEVNE